jgi:hypothetical protein
MIDVIKSLCFLFKKGDKMAGNRLGMSRIYYQITNSFAEPDVVVKQERR